MNDRKFTPPATNKRTDLPESSQRDSYRGNNGRSSFRDRYQGSNYDNYNRYDRYAARERTAPSNELVESQRPQKDPEDRRLESRQNDRYERYDRYDHRNDNTYPNDRRETRDSYRQPYRERETRDSYRERGPRERDPRERNPRSNRETRDTYRDTRGPYRERETREPYRERDTYRSNDRGNGRDRDSFQPQTGRPKQRDEDYGLSKEEIIAKYEKKLSQLQGVPTLDEMKVIDSKWGVKPKGFENVTSQRAKLSGLFPLPGFPRPVDFTKLEGMKDGLDILQDSSKIDPLNSRNASVLIIKDLDFSEVDYLKLVEYINNFLIKVDLKGVSLTNNVESKRKTKDNRNLIIEFKNNVCATVAFTLNEKTIPLKSISSQDVSEDKHITLDIRRPGEYVVQCLPPYSEPSDTVDEDVVDNPRKLTLLLNGTLTESELTEKLTQFAPLKGFKLLREVGTKESLNIAFVEFYLDPKVYSKTIRALAEIDKILESLNQQEYIKKALYSCLMVEKDQRTSIQDCPIGFKTLTSLVKNENVSSHPKLKVMQLINVVTAKDLVEDINFNFIQNDILLEVEQFGKVKSIKIPRPANDFTPGISQFSQPGLGKVYVEFYEEEDVLKAIMGLAGRMYNDRTVLCAFYDHDDYLNGLL